MTDKTKETLGGIAFIVLFFALTFGLPWFYLGLTGEVMQ